jgi:hypothetical protein
MKLQSVVVSKKHEHFKNIPTILSSVALAIYYTVAKHKKEDAYNFWIANPDT